MARFLHRRLRRQSGHTFAASREQLARVLFPNVQRLLFLFHRQLLVVEKVVSCFVVGLRMGDLVRY